MSASTKNPLAFQLYFHSDREYTRDIVLSRIVQAIGRRVPVLMDGGVRKGTDVFKALALGASAVMIGRPYLYGLAVAGAAGVARVVEILRTELEMTMGLTGCQCISQITPDRLWPVH